MFGKIATVFHAIHNFLFGKQTNLQISMEYCILSALGIEQVRAELYESDVMMVEEFQKSLDLLKVEKSFYVTDDENFMDIFRFFAKQRYGSGSSNSG